MLRSILLPAMLCLSVVSPRADDPVDKKSPTLDEWLVGQPRAAVLETLGEPTKVKRGKQGPILVYRFDSPRSIIMLPGPDRRIVTPTDAEPYPGERAPDGPAAAATGTRQGPLKRIAIRLDAEDRVISHEIVYRKKSKIRRESEAE